MTLQTFTWIFPPSAPGGSSSQSFIARNTTSIDGFGAFSVYKDDVVQLEFASPSTTQGHPSIQYECGISTNGTESSTGISKIINTASPANFTLSFLPLQESNVSNQDPSAATDICVFFFHDEEQQLFFSTVAFPILNTTRPQPYLYTSKNPTGVVYQPAKSPASSIRKGDVASAAVLVSLAVGLLFGFQ